MLTEDKVTDFFCLTDDFCKFFDSMIAKYTILTPKKHNNNPNLNFILSHFIA